MRERRLVDKLSKRGLISSWYVFVVIFFVLIVLLPTLWVLGYLVTGWEDIQREVLDRPDRVSLTVNAIVLSFSVAGVVVVFDLVVGLPLAWFLVRKEFRGKKFLNTLIDSPLAVPTAGLGFSVAFFWGAAQVMSRPPGAYSIFGGTSSAFIILILLHFATTFPYMVRSLSAILEEIDISYEVAARACGASRLTAARTVTLPMFRAGLATGAILVLAKALSDTGGVIAALATIGKFKVTSSDDPTAPCALLGEPNGTALIGGWKEIYANEGCTALGLNSGLLPALAFVSILMILLSIFLLALVRILATRAKFPLRKVWPRYEKALSKGIAPRAKDIMAFLFLVFIVLIPSFFLVGFVLTTEPTGAIGWDQFWASISLSFLVAGVATAIDIALGIPLAILITRGRMKRVGSALDTLVNVPYIVPSAALGFSLGLFWTGIFPSASLLILVIMAHVAFTFPFVVRNVVGALEQLDPALEETARTLGAKPIQVFRRVTFPTIKASILAGAIMAFTRSVGETGATIAISPEAVTAPVFIVGLVKSSFYYHAGLATMVLIAVSFVAILIMRYVTEKAR